jgi:hypothetical protein
MNTSSYNNFTLERCIFASCTTAYYGGVLYLDSSSPSINITSCRFEHNIAYYYGFDIYSYSSSCFSGYILADSCTTSTTSESVYCSGYKSLLTFPCDEEIVCLMCFLLNIFIFFFCLHVRRGVTRRRAVVTIV